MKPKKKRQNHPAKLMKMHRKPVLICNPCTYIYVRGFFRIKLEEEIKVQQSNTVRHPELGYQSLLGAIPVRLRDILGKYLKMDTVEEIRFRVNRHVQVVFSDDDVILNQYKCFSLQEAKEMLRTICGQSVYARENELCSGFVTISDGIRVGLSGQPIIKNGKIIHFTNVTGFNFRIAREIIGCSEGILQLVMEQSGPVSTLIAAPPGIGKTTLLRDIARSLSDSKYLGRYRKVLVVDERNELSGSTNGIPSLKIGERTDVISLTPKTVAIPLVIRSMSPDVIITDELSGDDDISAVCLAARCGVCMIASIHEDEESIKNGGGRVERLMKSGGFKKLILLSRKGTQLCGKSISVKTEGES